MGTIENFRQIIRRVLMEYTKIPYAYGQLECKATFDRESDSYLLVTVGWDGTKRVHGILVHIDIIDGKVWIQRDGTEYGIAYEIEKAGIPRGRIVRVPSPGCKITYRVCRRLKRMPHLTTGSSRPRIARLSSQDLDGFAVVCAAAQPGRSALSLNVSQDLAVTWQEKRWKRLSQGFLLSLG